MTTENKKHVENLVHHLDDVQKFVSTIWVKYHNPERLDEFRVALKRDGIINGQWNQTVAHFWIDPVRNELFKPCCPKNCPADLAEAFQRALAAIGDGEPIIETLLVEREDPSRALSWSNVVAVKPSEELYELAFSSWAETLNIEIAPESNQAAADPHKIRQQLITALILKLFSPKIDVQAWNACEHLPRWGKFEGEDFSQQTLDGIKLSSMGFKGANFDGTNLPGAVMTAADFSKATFVGSNLASAKMTGAKASGANFKNAKLHDTDFTGADLKNAIFDGADIVGANFNRANLQKANFSGAKVVRANFRLANLCAADLSGCDVDSSTKFADAKYDERTKLPADFSQLDSLLWKGKWPDPRIIARKERARAIGTIDFSEFIEHLQRNFDIARLKKTTQMLKKESFQLFSEVMPESVVGIVKSQTADDLVYSCQLTSDGNFCCATQNLNPCGGLKGALCKHILVLIIGLARSEKIDCQQAAQWVLMSKACAPKLNRETLTEVFLKYKGAQAGEIDWRPTETIPEDYYAF